VSDFADRARDAASLLLRPRLASLTPTVTSAPKVGAECAAERATDQRDSVRTYVHVKYSNHQRTLGFEPCGTNAQKWMQNNRR
jgi:hypothetical protein